MFGCGLTPRSSHSQLISTAQQCHLYKSNQCDLYFYKPLLLSNAQLGFGWEQRCGQAGRMLWHLHKSPGLLQKPRMPSWVTRKKSPRIWGVWGCLVARAVWAQTMCSCRCPWWAAGHCPCPSQPLAQLLGECARGPVCPGSSLGTSRSKQLAGEIAHEFY